MEIKDIESILVSKYNMNIELIEKSSESTDGNVYIISGVNTKCIVKVYDDFNHAKAMTKLCTYMNQIGLKAPSIIKNNKNEKVTNEGNYFIVCYTFVKGVKLKEAEFTNEIIANIAKYLRKLHGLKDNIFNLNNVPYKVDSNRKSALHFDVTKCNIFIDVDTDEICFIDFDDAKYGPSVCDVAIASTNLFMSKANGVDMNGMKLFIELYYEDDKKLKITEFPLIKDAAIKWLELIMDNPNFDTSTRAGLNNKLNIWRALELSTL